MLTFDQYYYSPNKTFQAFNLLLTTNSSITEPYFSAHPLKNLGFFAWYLSNEIYSPAQINSTITLANFLIAANTDIVIRPIYRNGDRILLFEGRSNYLKIYHIFDEDELFYLYPCPLSTNPFDFKTFTMNVDCLAKKNKNFSITCDEFYLETKNYSSFGSLINLMSPYVYSAPSENVSFWDSRVILAVKTCGAILDPSSKNLKLTTCIEANITDLKSFFANTSWTMGNYYIVAYSPTNYIGDVIFRKDFNLSSLSSQKVSLIEYEFGVLFFLLN